MNLTNTLSTQNFVSEKLKPFGLPIAILMLMVMMVIPLPSILLDVFFTTNILLSLLILMVSIHTFRPLDFSSFPTVLLFATILRLGLNVASTRIVLSAGHTGPDAAGKVIEAFGEFVIAGNYVVGIFVFAIEGPKCLIIWMSIFKFLLCWVDPYKPFQDQIFFLFQENPF